MKSSREQFEEWWEINYHNGNPPRFGWGAWRDGEGYKIDDDESELDGMWQAWQASRAAIEIEMPTVIWDMSEDGSQHYDREEAIDAIQSAGFKVKS